MKLEWMHSNKEFKKEWRMERGVRERAYYVHLAKGQNPGQTTNPMNG